MAILTGDKLSLLDTYAPRWSALRAAAGLWGHGPGELRYCTTDAGDIRRISADRGGQLGPGNPQFDPSAGGSSGTAHWLAPITNDYLAELVNAMGERVSDIVTGPPIDCAGAVVGSAEFITARNQLGDAADHPVGATRWLTNVGGLGAGVPTGIRYYIDAVDSGVRYWIPAGVAADAYQVAVRNGFVGTEPEWLQSLEGASEATQLSDIATLNDPAVGGSTVATNALSGRIDAVEALLVTEETDFDTLAERIAEIRRLAAELNSISSPAISAIAGLEAALAARVTAAQLETAVAPVRNREVATLAELGALEGAIEGQSVTLTDLYRGGRFTARTEDLSAAVTADTLQGLYVAGQGVTWVRDAGDKPLTQWMYHDRGADWADAFMAALANVGDDGQPAERRVTWVPGYYPVQKKIRWETETSIVSSGNASACVIEIDHVESPALECVRSQLRTEIKGFTLTHRDTGARDGTDDGLLDMIDLQGGANQCDIDIELLSSRVTRHGFTLHGERPVAGDGQPAGHANNRAYNNEMRIRCRRSRVGEEGTGTAIRLRGTSQVNTRCNRNNLSCIVASGWANALLVQGSQNNIDFTINPCSVSGITFQNDLTNGCVNNNLWGILDGTDWPGDSVVFNWTEDEYACAFTLYGPTLKGEAYQGFAADENGNTTHKASFGSIGQQGIRPAPQRDPTTPAGAGLIYAVPGGIVKMVGDEDGFGGGFLAASVTSPGTSAVRPGGAAIQCAPDSSVQFVITEDGLTYTCAFEASGEGWARFHPLSSSPDRSDGNSPIDGMMAYANGTGWDPDNSGERFVYRVNNTWEAGAFLSDLRALIADAPEYADNAAALVDMEVGALYHTGGALMVVI